MSTEIEEFNSFCNLPENKHKLLIDIVDSFYNYYPQYAQHRTKNDRKVLLEKLEVHLENLIDWHKHSKDGGFLTTITKNICDSYLKVKEAFSTTGFSSVK